MNDNVQSIIALLSTLVELLKLLPQLGNPIVSGIFAFGFAILAIALLIQTLNERQRLSKHADQIIPEAK